MLRATLKSLLARKLRLALTAISIVLGVGFVAGTFVLTDTMNKAFDQLFTDAAAGSRRGRPGRAGVRSERDRTGERRESRSAIRSRTRCCPRSKRSPGVASAAGDVVGIRADRRPGDGRPDRRRRSAHDRHELDRHEPDRARSGRARAPSAADDVVIDAATATTLRPHGRQTRQDPVPGSARGVHDLRASLGFGDADNLGGATLAAFDTADRPAGARQGGRVRLDLVRRGRGHGRRAAAGARSRTCCCPRRRGRHEHIGGRRAVRAAARKGSGSSGRRCWSSRSSRCSSASFIIFNTFSIIVAQRTTRAGPAARASARAAARS